MRNNAEMPAAPRLHPFILPLTLAGALPFMGCALAVWLHFPLSFDPAYVAVVYAAVILSFLGGIQWSFFLQEPAPQAWVILVSNLLALQGWVSVLLFAVNPVDICIFQALGFLIALSVDGGLYRRGFIPKYFFRLRQVITFIVVLSLLIIAVPKL